MPRDYCIHFLVDTKSGACHYCGMPKELQKADRELKDAEWEVKMAKLSLEEAKKHLRKVKKI